MLKQFFALLILLLFTVLTFAQDSYFAVSRYDYYTTEEMVEVAVWIPESKDDLHITVDIVFEYDFFLRGKAAEIGLVNIFYFSLDSLQPGRNEITVSYNENGKWVAADKIEIMILEEKPNFVKVDRVAESLLAKGEELDLRVNLNIWNLAGGIGPDHEGYRHYKDKKRLRKLRKTILAEKDNPVLLSWNISYDPQGQGIDPDQLLEAYEMIKELDPYHPVSISFVSAHDIDKYRPVMDLVILDNPEIAPEAESFLGEPIWPRQIR